MGPKVEASYRHSHSTSSRVTSEDIGVLVEPSNPEPSIPSNSSHSSHPSTQADVSSYQNDASSHQDDATSHPSHPSTQADVSSHQDDDDVQQAERVPGNGAMGGGDQGVGGGHDSAVLPLMGGGAGGGANALVEAALGDALV